MEAAGDHESEAYGDLIGVDGIGEVVAEAIVEFFAEAHNREVLSALLAEVSPEPLEAADTSSEVAGKTGRLYRYAGADDTVGGKGARRGSRR